LHSPAVDGDGAAFAHAACADGRAAPVAGCFDGAAVDGDGAAAGSISGSNGRAAPIGFRGYSAAVDGDLHRAIPVTVCRIVIIAAIIAGTDGRAIGHGIRFPCRGDVAAIDGDGTRSIITISA